MSKGAATWGSAGREEIPEPDEMMWHPRRHYEEALASVLRPDYTDSNGIHAIAHALLGLLAVEIMLRPS